MTVSSERKSKTRLSSSEQPAAQSTAGVYHGPRTGSEVYVQWYSPVGQFRVWASANPDGVAMEIYLYSNCSSCRKAEQVIQASGREYRRRDYFKDRFTVAELRALLERAGLNVTDALSTRSRAFADLKLAEKDLSDTEILELMVKEPTLLRRPLVIGNGASVVGFNAGGIQTLIEQS